MAEPTIYIDENGEEYIDDGEAAPTPQAGARAPSARKPASTAPQPPIKYVQEPLFTSAAMRAVGSDLMEGAGGFIKGAGQYALGAARVAKQLTGMGDEPAGLNEMNAAAVNSEALRNTTYNEKVGGAGADAAVGAGLSALTGGTASTTFLGGVGRDMLATGLQEAAGRGKVDAETGKATAVGGAFSSVLRGGGKLLGGLLGGPKGRLDTEAIDAAGREGIDLTASAKTDSPVASYAEALSAKGPFGSAMAARIRGAVDGIKDSAQAVIDAAPNQITSGSKTADAVKKMTETYRKTKNALYDAADMSGISIKMPESFDSLIELVSNKQSSLYASPRIGKIRAAVEHLYQNPKASQYTGAIDKAGKAVMTKAVPGGPKTLDGSVVRQTIADLGEAIQDAGGWNGGYVPPDVQIMKTVKKQLSEELEDQVLKKAGPDVIAAWNDAKDFYKTMKPVVYSHWANDVRRVAESGNISEINKVLTNPKLSIEDLGHITKELGPDVTAELQASALAHMLTEATNTATGTVSEGALRGQLKRWGPKLTNFFTPDQVRKMGDLHALSRAMGRGEKVLSGSQTAYLGKMGAYVATAMMNPLTTLKLMIGDAGLAHWISTEPGQEWLTIGLPKAVRNAKIGEDAAAIASNTGVAKSFQKDDQEIAAKKFREDQERQRREATLGLR